MRTTSLLKAVAPGAFSTIVIPENVAQPYMGTPRFRSPLNKRMWITVKRLFDLICSSLFIVLLLSWLVPLMAFLIKLDSRGPVFFLQKRCKKDGRFFTCIKFRTMKVNGEAHTVAATKDDHRITQLGKRLRKYHIDELPQFCNVWLGDMSIIGPRPYMLSDHQRFKAYMPSYELRYQVKPGMTGLAQSLGYHGVLHNEPAIKERTVLDLLYIKQWSVLMDLRIIGRTFYMLMSICRNHSCQHMTKTAANP